MKTCWELSSFVNGSKFGLSYIQKTFLWWYQSPRELEATEYIEQGRLLSLNASFSARQNIHISTLAEISVYQDDSNVHIDLLAKLEMLLFYIIR